MKSKKIITFVAALTALSIVTGGAAFAAQLNAEDDQAAETVAVEEVGETAETAEETEDAEESEADETADETEGEVDETKPAGPAEDGEKPEPPAGPAEGVKPVGKREIAAAISEAFDTENADFASDEAKAAWFAFVDENLTEPEPPVPPVEDDAEKPEPPVPPVEDDAEKPEPPIPPVEPEEPAVKPVGRHELIVKIGEVFDTEAYEFVSDDAKTEWFDFIELYLAEPQPPIPPAGPAVDGE